MAHAAAPQFEKRWSLAGRKSRAESRAEPVPFAELAYLHYRWRKALETDAPDLDARAERYHEARADFEATHGTIINEYWCWNVPSAVALTAKPRPAVVRWFLRPRLAFHRATDWATRDHPDVAEQLHRCDEVAVRATQVLSGLRRRICLHLVMTSASHLVSFVDARAAHEKPADVLAQETETLDATEEYYRNAANGQAQIIYFAGMAVVAAAICVVALLGDLWIDLPRVVEREFYGCMAAGALGAVLSVVQRINSGQFDLTYDVGRPYLSFLGGLRPVIGAVFGLVFFFAVASGILTIFAIPDGPKEQTARLFAYIVIAFLAGFSERWAQDTLTALGQGSAKTDPSHPPRSRPGPGQAPEPQ